MSLCYFPSTSTTVRITWYGGESTQLHYEELRLSYDPEYDQDWFCIETKTLGNGIPTQVKELYQEMVDFYNESQ
jgi:hypothetical protein